MSVAERRTAAPWRLLRSRAPGPAPRLRPWSGNRRDYLDETARVLDRVDRELGAFTHLEPGVLAAAIDPALGPLAGMPIAVKEVIDVAGMPVPLGSPLFAGRVPSQDAEAVGRLRAAGARVLGITTSTPFACGTTTATTNPHRSSATPGGSSAGSGAAVGAGIVPVALATQSQGSTLGPASYCGAWGYKPTHLRLPRAGMHLLSDTLDDLGLVAASLADLERVLAVLTQWSAASGQSALRVGRVCLDDGALPRPRTMATFDSLVHDLGGQGVEIVENTPELLAFDRAIRNSGQTCFDILAGESAPLLTGYVAAGEPDPRLREMTERAAELGPGGLATALAHRDELIGAHAALAGHVDVLITLSTTNPAPDGHAGTGCRRMPATASLLGVPALSAPWLTLDGMPQGVQLIGFADRDEELFAAARVLGERLPPVTGPREHHP